MTDYRGAQVNEGYINDSSLDKATLSSNCDIRSMGSAAQLSFNANPDNITNGKRHEDRFLHFPCQDDDFITNNDVIANNDVITNNDVIENEDVITNNDVIKNTEVNKTIDVIFNNDVTSMVDTAIFPETCKDIDNDSFTSVKDIREGETGQADHVTSNNKDNKTGQISTVDDDTEGEGNEGKPTKVQCGNFAWSVTIGEYADNL